MRLTAIANGMPICGKEIDGDELVAETRAIMWHIPEVERVVVDDKFTIRRDEICLCETDLYPCECGMAGMSGE